MRGRSAAALLVVVVLTAGCMGVILGEDDLEFESGETVIENETVASSGYELQHEETQTLNETVSVAEGNETRIIVRNHMARYGPESDLPSGIGPIQVGLITTPDASVAGQSVNPLLRMDSYERAFRFLPETDESGFERYGNYNRRALRRAGDRHRLRDRIRGRRGPRSLRPRDAGSAGERGRGARVRDASRRGGGG